MQSIYLISIIVGFLCICKKALLTPKPKVRNMFSYGVPWLFRW